MNVRRLPAPLVIEFDSDAEAEVFATQVSKAVENRYDLSKLDNILELLGDEDIYAES